MSTLLAEDATYYPTSDGKPMAESQLHAAVMIDLIQTLAGHFAPRPDVYVWGNLLVYYQRGDAAKVLAPDLFVAFGVPKAVRDTYKVWEEGGVFPAVVVEVTSATTKKEDMEHKFAVYRDVWKVDEYILFDPRAEYLDPPLQGFRRINGHLMYVEASPRGFRSVALGMYFQADGPDLVAYQAEPYRRIYPPAVQRALDEEAARHRAEAGRQLADQQRRRAEQERQRAEQERDAERRARLQTEAELARLRAELAALRSPPSAEPGN